MNIFESLENLNVSEECFNDIMGLVEELLSESDGIMPLMKKYNGDKKKAVKEWVKQRNQELKDAKDKMVQTERAKQRAYKSRKREDMPIYNKSGDYSMEKFYQKSGEAHQDYLKKWGANARANRLDVDGVKGKVDVPPLTKQDFIEKNKKKKK